MGKKISDIMPAAFSYAQKFTVKKPEEILADGLQIAMKLEELPYFVMKNGVPTFESGTALSELELFCCLIIHDLREGMLGYLSSDEINRRKKEKAAEESSDIYAELNGPITDKQIGYIAGLTKKLGLDRYDLPSDISPEENYKDLTEGQAISVIDALKKRVDEL